MDALPLYEILPGATGEGVHEVALVASPAIEIGWLAFARANFHPNCRCEITPKGTVRLSEGACSFCVEAKRAYNAARRSGIGAPAAAAWLSPEDLAFKSVSKERRMVAGPLMVPDLRIYRRDGEKEYEVFFSEETIRTFAIRFFREGRTSKLNEEHTDAKAPAFLVESWIVEDPTTDKSKALGFSVPKGTWFAVVHIEDEAYWNEAVKTGRVRGFSVEGAMSVAQATTKTNRMSKQKFSVTLDNGTVIANTEDTDVFSVGEELWVILESGEKVHAEDGQYQLPDGSVIDAVGGRIVALRPAEEMAGQSPDALEAFKAETGATLADLAGRIAALEAALAESKTAMAEQRKTIDEQSEELKKFRSQTPGARSITVRASAVPPAKPAKTGEKPRLTLAALESIHKYTASR